MHLTKVSGGKGWSSRTTAGVADRVTFGFFAAAIGFSAVKVVFFFIDFQFPVWFSDSLVFRQSEGKTTPSADFVNVSNERIRQPDGIYVISYFHDHPHLILCLYFHSHWRLGGFAPQR